MPAEASAAGFAPARYERLSTVLAATVLLSSLPLGAVQPGAWGLLALAVAAILAWLGWASLGDRAFPIATRTILVPLLSFGGALGWALIQASNHAPAAWHHPIWHMAGDALGTPLSGAISINPADTADGAVRLATYAGIFYAALVVGRDAANAARIVRIVALACGCYAVYSLAAFLSGTETILWFAKTHYRGDLTGTFVNRNNFASVAGIGLLCSIAVLAAGLPRLGEDASRREWLRAWLDHFSGRAMLYLYAAACTGASLLMSHSRAGLLSTLAGVAIFAAIFRRRAGKHACRGRLVATLSTVALVLAFGAGSSITLDRLSNAAEDAPTRLRVMERTVDAIADRPLLGTGLGTFREAFRAFRTEDIADSFHQAHNVYLELAMELGLPAAACLMMASAWMLYRCISARLGPRRHSAFPCLGIAVIALVGLHSLVDFSLQIPAIAALFALVMGVAVAQSRPKVG